MFEKIKRIIEMVKNPPDKNWHIEKQGKPSKTHPLGGFWKRDLKNDHGLAIGKAPRGLYFISFCGPSGCFEKGTYRPNSAIVGDSDYRILDKNTIEVKGRNGFNTYTRVNARKKRLTKSWSTHPWYLNVYTSLNNKALGFWRE
ncbi:hypothetical protein ACU6U9_22965 [Pseudomonas sp. HK3]